MVILRVRLELELCSGIEREKARSARERARNSPAAPRTATLTWAAEEVEKDRLALKAREDRANILLTKSVRNVSASLSHVRVPCADCCAGGGTHVVVGG